MGRVYRLKAYQVPEAGRTARGTAIVNLLMLEPNEKVTTVIPVAEYRNDLYLIMATKQGFIKKTKLMQYDNIRRGGLAAVTLRDDDELIDVKLTDGTQEVMMVTKNGLSIRFKEKNVRWEGQPRVIGIRLTRMTWWLWGRAKRI